MQLTTGGACHLELSLVERGWHALPKGKLDFLFIENVGNLVCPSSHDLGEDDLRVVVLSTTEGDDKPGKYPKAFRTAQLLVINKLDLLPHLPFSVESATLDARNIQPALTVLPLSAWNGARYRSLVWLFGSNAARIVGYQMPDTLRNDCVAPRSLPDSPAANIRRLRIILRRGSSGAGRKTRDRTVGPSLGFGGRGVQLDGRLIDRNRRGRDGYRSVSGRTTRVAAGSRGSTRKPRMSRRAQPISESWPARRVEVEVLTATVPADTAICQQCLTESRQVGNRRQGFAFTTCTRCGPRYSLINRMPYDRAKTSMQRFPLCAPAGADIVDPSHRRYHSQTNSCPQCGPRLWLDRNDSSTALEGHYAISAAVKELRIGRVVALRGVGGYQLMVDATSSGAVRELRTRKRRFDKPLAVMVNDLAAVEPMAITSNSKRAALSSPCKSDRRRPIPGDGRSRPGSRVRTRYDRRVSADDRAARRLVATLRGAAGRHER